MTRRVALGSLFGALLLLAVAAANAATISLPPLPSALWFGSTDTLRTTISEAAPGGNGVRLALRCGAGVTVSPAGGFCLDQPRTTFDFTLTAGVVKVTDAACAFVLHEGAAPFYDPLPQQSSRPIPVLGPPGHVPHQYVGVSPWSNVNEPLLIGPGGIAALRLWPMYDLTNAVAVSLQCNNLAAGSSAAVTVQRVDRPGWVFITMGAQVGFVECHYSMADPILSERSPSFFRIVAPMQLAATGIPTAGAVVAGDLPGALVAGAIYTLSVASPSIGLPFGLTLTCTGMALLTAIFTADTTTAQMLSITTPAAPINGGSAVVQCAWSGSGTGYDQRRVAVPIDFSFIVGGDFSVTVTAAPAQLRADAPTSVVSMFVPADTVLSGGLTIDALCSDGSLSKSTFALSSGALTAEAVYTASPTVGAASTAECTFTVRREGEYRRVKAAISPLTFSVAAGVAKHQLVAAGLPTAADAIVQADVPSMVNLATAAAGVAISLGHPLSISTGNFVIIGLSCSAPTSAWTVSVTPPQTFTSASTGPASFIITANAPFMPNEHSATIACSWAVDGGASTASEVVKLALPADFNFLVGSAVQLEVRQSLESAFSLSALPVSHTAKFHVQTANDVAASVGGPFLLALSCTPCSTGLQTGEARLSRTELTVGAGAFPQQSYESMEIRAKSPGAVTCHWSLPAGNAWSRAFLPPPPTVVTILPLMPVMGVPNTGDIIPLSQFGFFFPGSVRSGEQFTISMPAAPAAVAFGAQWNNFTLRCEDVTFGGASVALGIVSGGGRFHYRAASRAAQSVVLTMPVVRAERPMQIRCAFQSEGRGPLSISTADAHSPSLRLMVVAAGAETALVLLAPAMRSFYEGDTLNVWFEPSRTVRLARASLVVDVSCGLSAPVVAMDVVGLGIARLDSWRKNLKRRSYTFQLHSDDTETLTAGATDPALRYGYKLTLPDTPTTLTCMHTLRTTGPNHWPVYADQQLSLAPAQPLVITVLPKQAITVTGVPTAPLTDIPAAQTISVQPTLPAGNIFSAAQTLEVTLICSGLTLPSGGLLTFTGTNEAVIAAQSIRFTPPAVAAGEGNVWRCSWSLGGSDAPAFLVPSAFSLAVGTVHSWRVQLHTSQLWYMPVYASNVYTGVATSLSGCMPATGTLVVECDRGISLQWYGGSAGRVAFTRADLSFEFNLTTSTDEGNFECRFRLDDVPAGFPLLPPAPERWYVRRTAGFTISGLPVTELGRDIVLETNSTSVALSIRPELRPDMGVTVTLRCSPGVQSSVWRFYFPTGSFDEQPFELRVSGGPNYFEFNCSWHVMSTMPQWYECDPMEYGCTSSSFGYAAFEEPRSFRVHIGVRQTLIISGLDAEKRITSPDVCSDVSFSIAPSVAPTEGSPVILRMWCVLITPFPNEFTFTAASPQTVIIRAPGVAVNSVCVISDAQTPRQFETSFTVVFGAPPAITISMPTFVPRGAVVPIAVHLSAPAPLDLDHLAFKPLCSFGGVYPQSGIVVRAGESNATALYNATIASDEDEWATESSRVAADEASTTPAEMARSAHVQRKRAATAAAVGTSTYGVSDDAAGGYAAAASKLVVCNFDYRDAEIGAHFIWPPPSDFTVGTPVNLVVTMYGTNSVRQSAAGIIAVTLLAPVPVNVAVSVECTPGVSASPTILSFVANGMVDSQQVALAVAADVQPGAAVCMLTPTGPGSLAVLNSPSFNFTVQAGAGCGDYECDAICSLSLPGLAAGLAMSALLLAAALEQLP